MFTHIFWDYNGTILDDVEVSVRAVNCMLEDRGLPTTDVNTYKNTLTLPLELYYKSVGITDVPVSELSIEFRKYCKEYSYLSSIFSDFPNVINSARDLGIKNVLFSSLYEKHLTEELMSHGIYNLFDDVIGMQDLSVGTKTANASEYINSHNIDVKNVVFIGDLTTDADMAIELGAQCILIPNGHNSKERCLTRGVDVYESLSQIIGFISNT